MALVLLDLPKTIQLFGSLGFNREGKIVPPLNVFRGGPSEIHQLMITSNLHEPLAAADKGLIKGWQANGLQPRLEKLFFESMDRIVQKLMLEMKG